MRSFSLLVPILSLIASIKAVEFQYDLPVQQIQCFGDSLGALLHVTGEVTTDSEDLVLRVYDSSGQIKDNSTSQDSKLMRFAFTTENAGSIQICFGNQGRENIHLFFKYNTGADAKDYTALTQVEDMKPINITVKRIDDMLNTIQMETKFLLSREDTRVNQVQNISFKMIGFSIITLGLITLLTFFQMSYLQNFFQQKKLI